MDRFRADAEAVNAQLIDGVVVVITPPAGAMAQAAIGGRQIADVPK